MEKMTTNWMGLTMFLKREYDRMFRVAIQVFVSPWISAFLFIFIFGSILGSQIDLIGGVPYINFVFPGILMMNVIQAAFLASSSSLYFARFLKSIEEILVAPFSYLEMIAGFVGSAVIRTVLIAIGIVGIGFIFQAVYFVHPLVFLLVTVGVSMIFALLGIIVGLWSKNFEQLSLLPTFILMPLSFFGGMFNTLDLLPPVLRAVTIVNPFFYFIDAMRYAMIGTHESNLVVGAMIIIGLVVLLSLLVWHLFRIGWRLRE